MITDEEVEALRAVVAEQLAVSLVERALPGDRSVLARRIAELAAAERTSDPLVLRGAIMEVSLASAEWVVQLDASRSR